MNTADAAVTLAGEVKEARGGLLDHVQTVAMVCDYLLQATNWPPILRNGSSGAALSSS